MGVDNSANDLVDPIPFRRTISLVTIGHPGQICVTPDRQSVSALMPDRFTQKRIVIEVGNAVDSSHERRWVSNHPGQSVRTGPVNSRFFGFDLPSHDASLFSPPRRPSVVVNEHAEFLNDMLARQAFCQGLGQG